MGNELALLSNISDIFSKIKYGENFTEEVSDILKSHIDSSELNIYIYDKSTNSLRNFSKSWVVIDEKIEDKHSKDLYNAFKNFGDNKFIFNGQGYKQIEDAINLQTKNTLIFPLIKNAKHYGLMELAFDSSSKLTGDFITAIQVLCTEISLIIQNKILYEKMEKNVDFHDAMKNIAKIIETQYELNYIIPLIGEMIDKFIIEHLIYIFLKSEDGQKYNLVWPLACRDKKILNALSRLDEEQTYFLTDQDRIGIFPLTGEDNKILGCVVAHSNIDKLNIKEIEYLDQLTKQAAATITRANIYAEVLKHATLDALTGINNRHQFEIRLKQEVAASMRQNIPLCAIMLDIDFFKSVNDTYGHAAGDTVLKEVSNTIKNSLRESDIPSRYGGEEFAILLPFTKLEEAYGVAQRLRAAVEQQEIDISEVSDYDKINVTVSIGVSEFDRKITGEELYRRADKALYSAKTHGRNKVVIYTK